MTKSLYEHMQYMAELNAVYDNPVKEFDRRLVLRQYYMDAMHEIIDIAKQSPVTWANIYPFDWKFNVNEENLWASIRSHSVVFYPEFPVFDRFIDFGNPFFRIGLEADSIEHHSKDKDMERDQLLRKAGWTIFRVPYHESKNVVPDLAEILELKVDDPHLDDGVMLEEFLFTTSDGIVAAIEYFYFMDERARSDRDHRFSRFRGMAESTLRKHCLLVYDLPF